MGSCLILGNELSGDTHADKAKDFIGKECRGERSRVREPRRTALPRGSRSQVLQEGCSFLGCLWPIVLLGPYLVWLRALLGWYRHLSAKMDSSSKDPGRLVVSSKIILVSVQGSTMFLIRTYCCETTHAGGYCSAWPR